MDTTIQNLKRQSGIGHEDGDALSLMAEARELRARTLATLFARVAVAARTRLSHASRPTPMHPAG